MVGVELELEHSRGYAAILAALPDTANTNLRPSTEMDGSLDDYRGVEIVFPPMSPSQLSNGNSFIRRSFKALDESGAHGGRNCGMHVNINTFGWDVRVRNTYISLFFLITQDTLCAIGGRSLTNYCEQWFNLNEVTNQAGVARWCRNNHNTVVSVRPDRVELRFPAATTNIEKLQTVVAFSNYVKQYAESITGTDLNMLTKEPWSGNTTIRRNSWGDHEFRPEYKAQVTKDLLTLIRDSKSCRSKSLVMKALNDNEIMRRYGINARLHRSTSARPAL